MPEGEFRVGDVVQRGPGRPTAGREGLDAQAFPLLVEWMRLAAPAFRERLDALAARARSESSQAAQQAISLAVQVLNALYKHYGGLS